MTDTTVLPDGSAFFTGSFPLPKDHWLYAPRCAEWDNVRDTTADTPHPILNNSHRPAVIAAIRYAVRGATMCGQDMDFDPDALALNAAYALCGPATGRTLPADTSQPLLANGLTETETSATASVAGLTLCWCLKCRPLTLADMRMAVCPSCGDKRCVHAADHAAPCAKDDIYAHNLWVERAAQPPSAPLPSMPADLREKLIEAFAEGLDSALHCKRVWSAWAVGTMSEDDFSPVAESDTPAELADAVLSILATAPQPMPAAPETPNIDARIQAIAADRDYWREQALAATAPVGLDAGVAAPGWLPIGTAPVGRILLVGYFNRAGKWRSVRGRYYGPEELESEISESGWADEGWYEECDNAEEINFTDEPPTHWMPLPGAPQAQAAPTGEQPA